jgi:hypothetical protein
VQAVLIDPLTLDFRLTNGVVGQVQPPGAHEIRYGVTHHGNGTGFSIRRFDVDALQFLGSTAFTPPMGSPRRSSSPIAATAPG